MEAPQATTSKLGTPGAPRHTVANCGPWHPTFATRMSTSMAEKSSASSTSFEEKGMPHDEPEKEILLRAHSTPRHLPPRWSFEMRGTHSCEST